MAIKVYKNQKESLDRLISRFNKKVQGSRIILEVKNRRYYKKPKTRRLVRAAAVKREFYRAKRDKMQYY
ncbi:30S ribosomal protein S21 [Patescibacteria group bacterium]|nr:30S ribosomal protein S21 [Patescibacteria group bacterium]MBU1702780.1 30S ribosomal protein S21 [Patescibacteria group bacterium]MBU1954092.1 30S ribosomal protein S21 [Patescibacteria group bacterium]